MAACAHAKEGSAPVRVSAVLTISVFLVTHVAICIEKVNRAIVSMSGERAIGSPRSGN